MVISANNSWLQIVVVRVPRKASEKRRLALRRNITLFHETKRKYFILIRNPQHMRTPIGAETPVCISCLETIHHPLCASCLTSSTYEWLETRNSRVKVSFSEFIPRLITRVRGGSACIRCPKKSGVCPYCFTEIVSRWLDKRAPRLSMDYRKIFNFDFNKTGYSVGRFFSTKLMPETAL